VCRVGSFRLAFDVLFFPPQNNKQRFHYSALS
jgi:hypothetical protein